MIYSVSQISNDIKTLLLKNIPDKIIVEGEISNFKNSNGNLFFTLKDEDSSISTVSWSYEKYFNADNLKNGDKVQVHGKIACYSKNGTYSLQIFKIEKQGIGDLHSSYEKLKLNYQNKGYFDEQIKKKLPSNISNIGIITSPEGAAIQDILFVLNKNKFQGNIYIKRCMVQGNQCPKSIAESIEFLNNFKTPNKKKLDLILVTRGGGSFEDLMGYSDPKVIEAIYESDIFVISAVGHEIDFMLSDFVADLRAPTPSIAAEIISKKQKETIDNLVELENFFVNNYKTKVENIINNYYSKLELFDAKNKNPNDILNNKLNELNFLEDSYSSIMKNIITKYKNNLNMLELQLDKHSILENNGQIFVKDKRTFKLCNSINDFKDSSNLIKLIFKDGEVIITPKKIDLQLFNET